MEQPLHDLAPWQPPAPVAPPAPPAAASPEPVEPPAPRLVDVAIPKPAPALVPAPADEARVGRAASADGQRLAKTALIAAAGVTGGAALYFLLPHAHWMAMAWLLGCGLLLGKRLSHPA